MKKQTRPDNAAKVAMNHEGVSVQEFLYARSPSAKEARCLVKAIRSLVRREVRKAVEAERERCVWLVRSHLKNGGKCSVGHLAIGLVNAITEYELAPKPAKRGERQ